jgi:hypothetical protein
MSEPFLERLTRFTPDAGTVDRDALLFAAGRASARPNRSWMCLAAALAGSNLLALVTLWPQPIEITGRNAQLAESPRSSPMHELPATAVAQSDVWSVRHDLEEAQHEDRTDGTVTLVDGERTWRAFGPLPASIMN